jgi:outer membrane assembly lipoprotein YfiO
MIHLPFISQFLTKPGNFACAFALTLVCSGCSSSSDPSPEPEAKELRADSDPLATEVPEAELTHLSKRLYQVGMYTVARDSLASLKDRYPLGAHASFAELKHADSYFFNHENNLAAKMYEDFLKNHPGSAEAPYAKLQAARSHVASARTSGRDRIPWERALTMYDEIVTTYAGTSYADVARQERRAVIKELSAYDREIIEFYRRSGNTAAVEERERRFTERWGTRLSEVESSASTESTAQFKSLRDLPPVSFQASQPASALIGEPSSTAQVLASSDSSTSVASLATSGEQSLPPSNQIAEGRIVVQSVNCSAGDPPFATIELQRVPEQVAEYEAVPGLLEPQDGKVILRGLNLGAREKVFNCFGSADLEISDQGDLELTTQTPLSITVLQNPARILLAPSL